jgi:hypothetical protein
MGFKLKKEMPQGRRPCGISFFQEVAPPPFAGEGPGVGVNFERFGLEGLLSKAFSYHGVGVVTGVTGAGVTVPAGVG